MKKNYDFRINPKPLSSEEIRQHQDFDALLRQLEEVQPVRRPARLRRLLYVASTAAAACLAGWLIFNQVFIGPPYSERAERFFAERPFLSEPLAGAVEADFASYRVDANQGGVFEYRNGSRLFVPAAAFEDLDGKVVEGEVNIRYREMHDYIDFFLSDIPMAYDSTGRNYVLESAGMMEIYAEQNGQRVRMRPGKTIDVELVSEIDIPNINVPPRYSVYRLDTLSRKWVYEDVDRLEILEANFHLVDPGHPFYETQAQFRQYLSEIEAAEELAREQMEASFPLPAKPIRPVQYNPAGFVFDFSFSEQAGGATHPYAGALWQLSPDETATEETLNRSWSDMRLQRLNNLGYELTLIDGDKQVVVKVQPVLSGADYQRALETYNRELEIYEQLVAEREATLTTRFDSLQTEFLLRRQSLSDEFQRQYLAYLESGRQPTGLEWATRRKVINRFKADRFGIWNCSRPLPEQTGRVKGHLVDQDGRPFEGEVAYLVDRRRNSVSRIYVDARTELHFDANSDNLLWLVTDDQKLAVFRPADFREVPPGSDEFTFVLQIVDRPIGSEAELREILYF
ncbi:MAG: hypothetical protein KDC32_27750 [Saprospiraceae bacterium]|nr:hypothetical protein [Saprospiraceae bacterium]